MCFSYEVSVITFIIGTLGTIHNLNYSNKTNNKLFKALTIAWISPILMQLWEAFIWKKYYCNLTTKLAYITNILQPITFVLAFWYLDIIPKQNVSKILIIAIIYLALMRNSFNKNYKCILKDCGVDLDWWNDDINGNIYVVAMLILNYLLIDDQTIMLQQVGYFSLSLLAANILTKYINRNNCYSGKIGSIWCFFAAFAPFYNYYTLS